MDVWPENGGPTVVPAKLRAPPGSGLERARLTDKLHEALATGFGTVVGPAGAGKTTVLAHFLARVDAPSAWYRADESDGGVEPLLAHLERAFCTSLTGLAGGWRSLEAMIADLEGWSGRRAVLVVDDFHTLEGTPAEDFVARLVEYAPASLVVLLAARRQPRFNLSRRRIDGRLTELAAHDLRFRSWEVERLFKDVYRSPLAPEEAAEVTSRTEGWPAVLQLFHLATSGKPAARRRETLGALSTRSRLVREYLTQNILEDLPDELRRFLLDTCVLPRLSGPLCDALLGRHRQPAPAGADRVPPAAAGLPRRRQLPVPRGPPFLPGVDPGGRGRASRRRGPATAGRGGCWRRPPPTPTPSGPTPGPRTTRPSAGSCGTGARSSARSRVRGSRPCPAASWPATPGSSWPRPAATSPAAGWPTPCRATGPPRAPSDRWGRWSRPTTSAWPSAGGWSRSRHPATTGWVCSGRRPGGIRWAPPPGPAGSGARTRPSPRAWPPSSPATCGTRSGCWRRPRARRGRRPAWWRWRPSPGRSPRRWPGCARSNGWLRAYETFEELGQPWLAQLCQAVLEAVEPETQRPPGPEPADGGWGRALAAVLRAGIGAPPGDADELADGRVRVPGRRGPGAGGVGLGPAGAGPGHRRRRSRRPTALAAERLARTAGARGAAVMAYRALALTDPGQRANHEALAAAVAQECGLRTTAAAGSAERGRGPSAVDGRALLRRVHHGGAG